MSRFFMVQCVLLLLRLWYVGVWSIAMSVWTTVFMSVRSKITFQNFMNFFVHVTCSHGSVILSRQCNTLCTSGFVDDVMFARNRPGKGDANMAYMLKVAHRLSYCYYHHHNVIIIIIIKCYRFSDILFLPVIC